MSFCFCFPSPFPASKHKALDFRPEEEKKSDDHPHHGILKATTESWDLDHSRSNGSTFRRKSVQFENSPPSYHQRHLPSEESMMQIPLKDSSNSKEDNEFHSMDKDNYMTLRDNPKMRLLTSASSISENNSDYLEEEDTENDDNDWVFKSSLPMEQQVFDVGLMIIMHDNHCQFHLVPDSNYPVIHPNVYAPANLTDMRILYGGGSGVSVFGGHHPQLGDLVMKHGGYKDLQELFALATVSAELKRRGQLLGNPADARVMQDRLPCFRMIYMSPHHIMDRGKELVNVLQNFVRNWSMTSVPSDSAITASTRLKRLVEQHPQVHLGMTIRIFEGEDEEKPAFVLNTRSTPPKMSLVLPAGSTDFLNERCIQLHGNAYDSLETVVEGLMPIMTNQLFKFTLAQKTIGGPHPKTGNQWLYEGQLRGPILKTLLDQMIDVIRCLQRLTLPEEVDVVDLVRAEVERFENDDSRLRASDISETADAFVGNAIKKNFHPRKGRQRFLREISEKFRSESLLLIPEEELPARHLGVLLRNGALMSDEIGRAHV